MQISFLYLILFYSSIIVVAYKNHIDMLIMMKNNSKFKFIKKLAEPYLLDV